MELPVTTNNLLPEANVIGKITIGDEELKQIFEDSMDGAEYKVSFAFKNTTYRNNAYPDITDIVEVMLVTGDE